jgi:hemoglobin
MISRRFLCIGLATAAGPPAAAADDALYRALGGRGEIEAAMREMVVRLRQHPRIGPFFRDTNLEHLATQLTDQICQLSGGPCEYRGVPMKLAHEAFEIDRGDFNALVEVLQQSLAARGIAFRTQNALLARLAPMYRDIVTVR